jgi:hypothetical protein
MAELPDLLDQRLDRLFDPIKLSPEFEVRLMARVQVESDYRVGVIAATQKRRRLLGFLALDVAAAGALLIFAEALAYRLLQSAPSAVKDSALWQLMGTGGLSGLLALMVIAAGAAILWPDLDYGRSPE